jgi:hypothetical protein
VLDEGGEISFRHVIGALPLSDGIAAANAYCTLSPR